MYRVNGAPATWQSRVAAAQLAVGEHAVVSHRSAAALYGLDGFDQQRTMHLSLPVGHSPRKQNDVRIHRCADYELIAPERRQNIPVTDPGRLVLDLYASEANPAVARRGLFSVRKKRLATWAAIDDCLGRHARQGRRGITLLRPTTSCTAGWVARKPPSRTPSLAFSWTPGCRSPHFSTGS